MRLRAIVFIATSTAALLAAPVVAQETIGFSQVIKAVDGQRRANAELANAAARAESEVQEEAERLKRDETRQDHADAGIAEFRQLRSDVDGRKMRLSNIRARVRYAEEQVAQVGGRIAALEQSAPANSTRLEDVAATVELRKLRELRDLIAESIRSQERGLLATDRRLALLNERMALIQSRSHLTSLDETKELDRDPRVAAIRGIIMRLGDESVRLGNEAASLNSAAPEVQRRRQLLELQADGAFILANLRTDDIELLGTGRQIEFLQMLLSEPSVPLRLINEGLAALERVGERVERRRDSITDIRRQLAEQSSALTLSSANAGPEAEKLQARASHLATLARDQEDEVGRLQSAVGNLRQELGRRAKQVEAEALLERASLPVDGEAWGRLAASMPRLPLQIGQGFKRAGEETIRAVRDTPKGSFATLGIAAVILGLGFAATRPRWIMHGATAAFRPQGALAAPAAALRDNVYTLIPAVAWLAIAWLLGISKESTLLVLSVLAVWPVVALLLDLSRRLLFSDPQFTGSTVRRRFYRHLRWTLILGGVLAGLVTLTRTLPINPALANLIDRSAMLCLLLIAVPGMLLPQVILAACSSDPSEPSLRVRVAAGLSILVPIALASAALLGLIGYLNLAWSIAYALVWLGIVGGIWALLLGLLQDTALPLRRRFAATREAGGDFWIANFFEPAYRFAQLALALVAGSVLVRIYGWTAETPIVRHLFAVGRTPVITLGQASLTLQDIAVAVVLVALAFWLGGWSRQISYNLALTRIRDLGIRQSLSVFVQYVVTVLGLVLTLKIIGLDLTALTVFAASLGVGIGFGMQNVVNNFISGVLLLAERPLRAGDVVTIAGNTGEVTRIGIRSLTVRTPDEKDIIIPNSAVISETFTNWTRTDDTLRETLQFRISDGDDDPEHTAAWMAEVAKSTEGVLPHPPPKASVWDFTDSSSTVRVEYAVRMHGPMSRTDVRANILRRLRRALAAKAAEAPDGGKPLQKLAMLG